MSIYCFTFGFWFEGQAYGDKILRIFAATISLEFSQRVNLPRKAVDLFLTRKYYIDKTLRISFVEFFSPQECWGL